jgi:hypothetical protein
VYNRHREVQLAEGLVDDGVLFDVPPGAVEEQPVDVDAVGGWGCEFLFLAGQDFEFEI